MPRRVRESTNQTKRSTGELAAYQPGRARQFIRDGIDGGVQFVALRIALAAIVDQSIHPRDTDRNFSQPLSPRPAEAIRDDYRKRKPEFLLDFAIQSRRRSIGIFRQNQCLLPAIDIGNIHSAVGTDEAVASFGDKNVSSSSNDSAALRNGEGGDAGVQTIAASPGANGSRGPDRLQVNQLAFRLGDDLVLHHLDI